MEPMTFAELHKLEKETLKNKSKNLSGLVTPRENIILCLAEFKKVSLNNWRNSVNYFILTDYRLIAECTGFTNVLLDKIVSVKVDGSFTTSYILIGLPESLRETAGHVYLAKNGINYHHVFPHTKDKAYVKWLADELNKYISEAKIRPRLSEINRDSTQSPNNSIVSQLEQLSVLYKSGAITEAEFNKAKDKLLQ